MVFNLTHSQLILRYKENGGRIEPYNIVIMSNRIQENKVHVIAIILPNCHEFKKKAKCLIMHI
jgi:hypothetical protein